MANMNNDEHYGAEFLYSEDLLRDGKYTKPTIEISEVFPPGTLKCQGGRKVVDKWTVGFKNAKKRLVLCKTNVSVLKFVTGNQEGDGWIGKQVTLQVRIVDAFGAPTTAIRIMPPKGTVLRKSLVDRLGKEAVFQG